ncbi:MAG: hypothetical protein ACC707_17465, partial [Thiohalomonadales bacterium]
IYSTELYLHSEKQPDVRVLTCSHWENPLDASHLSVNQIQNAVGKIISFEGGRPIIHRIVHSGTHMPFWGEVWTRSRFADI